MLTELPIRLSDRPLSDAAAEFLREGRARFKSVNCFDFVPSDYELLWRVFDAQERGRFCEWGSGFGLATGVAELLGFDAFGIEIDTKLADASRRLLADFQLKSPIETLDYLDSPRSADLYFVYCWPGRMAATEAHFEQTAPHGARLLICHGQSDVRCKVRADAAEAERLSTS
jgi:hypothetical protein